jgi:hypothetical protein
MSTIYYQELDNSFAVEDWNAAGVSGQGFFTSAVPTQRAPKKLARFAWSLMSSASKGEQANPSQEYRAAIDALFEHTMTKKEAAYFRRERASAFVPLTPEQTRLLPPRER